MTEPSSATTTTTNLATIATTEEDDTSSSSYLSYFSFWILGLLNNISYVIMLACAKSISEGGTALVFVANIIPSLLLKLSAPYWFHLVSYNTRMAIGTIMMMISFYLIASTMSSTKYISTTALYWQLLGVAFASSQCGLGEASLLALAGKYDSTATNPSLSSSSSSSSSSTSTKGVCLTSFSSGTGLAGIGGFFWKFFWNDFLGLSLSMTLWIALSLSFMYIGVYYVSFWEDTASDRDSYTQIPAIPNQECTPLSSPNQPQTQVISDRKSSTLEITTNTEVDEEDVLGSDDNDIIYGNNEQQRQVKEIEDMTTMERFYLVLSLWPYMFPLFLVYATEYALQAGTWTSIGFPITDRDARDRFYEYSNWMYQVGVFVSRSSGTCFTSPMWVLWLMPILQTLNVVFFSLVAIYHYPLLYNYSVLLPVCFYVGLLGGGVYISGYKRICADLPKCHVEFALAATSVSEGFGILLADISGLFIQGCLYNVNNLSGAIVSCPI